MVNSDLKILFCGMLKSPFILQDFELLNSYYNVDIINLDNVQTKTEYLLYMWFVTLKVIINILKCDIIYIWFADYPTFPLLFVAKLFGKKSIVTVGGWEVAAYPEINYGNQLRPFRGVVTRWCLRNSTIILVPSYAYKIITRSLEPRSNVCVIPNAIDISLCEHPLPDKSNTVVTALFTLQFTSILKGIPTFKEAAKKVPYSCIIYEGINHDLLMDKLRESKVYCQLSYTESFGVTNLEAMACGCVPIVTNRDALPEIIGDTGLVVPYGDVEATVKAIHTAMLMDGSAARERSKFYTRDTRLNMLAQVLENGYRDNPRVSVVIPAYNAAQWLPDTIQSILNQTYSNIEIMVVDDCSTDNTYDVVSKFPTVKYIKNSVNSGECKSSKRGFEMATGDYICRLSADDMYANIDKIKHQVEIMERTGADWSYNSINCMGETLNTAKSVESVWLAIPFRYAYKFSRYFDNVILKFPYLSFLRLFAGNPVNSSTLMFRKLSYIKSVTWEDGELRTDCDGFLILNSFLQRFKCVAIQEMGSFYRIHPNQMSYNSKYLDEMRGNRLKSMQKVIDGDYPLWFKCGVKIVRRKMYGF